MPPLENEGSARHALGARRVLMEDKEAAWEDFLARHAEFDDLGHPIFNKALNDALLMDGLETNWYAAKGGDVVAAQFLVKQFGKEPEATLHVKVERASADEVDGQIVATLVAHGYEPAQAAAIAAAAARSEMGPLIAAYEALKQKELPAGEEQT